MNNVIFILIQLCGCSFKVNLKEGLQFIPSLACSITIMMSTECKACKQSAVQATKVSDFTFKCGNAKESKF